MPVPDYQSFLLPVVRAMGDGEIHSKAEIREATAQVLRLTDADLKELLPSGAQTVFENRIGWAMTYLTKAGLLQRPKQAHYQITQRGREALSTNSTSLTTQYLKQFPEFMEFMSKTHQPSGSTGGGGSGGSEKSPLELIEAGYQTLRAELAEQILERVMACSPEFFERLVVNLLVAMGYGGSRADAGRAVGKSGDGGIDGIVEEDRLGLDVVYLQAKRWEGIRGGGQGDVLLGGSGRPRRGQGCAHHDLSLHGRRAGVHGQDRHEEDRAHRWFSSRRSHDGFRRRGDG